MDYISRLRATQYVARVVSAAAIGRLLREPSGLDELLLEEIVRALPARPLPELPPETRAAILEDLRALLAACEGRAAELLEEDLRDQIAAYEGRER